MRGKHHTSSAITPAMVTIDIHTLVERGHGLISRPYLNLHEVGLRVAALGTLGCRKQRHVSPLNHCTMQPTTPRQPSTSPHANAAQFQFELLTSSAVSQTLCVLPADFATYSLTFGLVHILPCVLPSQHVIHLFLNEHRATRYLQVEDQLHDL